MKKVFSYIGFPFAWLYRTLNDKIYDLKVKIHSKRKKKDPLTKKNLDKIKDLAFFWGFMIIPLALFVLTHIVINGNSILLAFQTVDENGKTIFAGFGNFAKVFENLGGDAYRSALKNALIVYGINLCITPLPIIFSYYCYKKCFGHQVFKIILFLPTILSSIVTVYMFKALAEDGYIAIMQTYFDTVVDLGLIINPDTVFPTILFYSIWMGLGGSLLTHLASMNTVDPSVSEAAYLDGIGFFGELWHIVLPASYQVITLSLIMGVVNIFGNTLNMYAFDGKNIEAQNATIGYLIQIQTLEATNNLAIGAAANDKLTYLSAWGVFVTVIAVPITLLLKHVIYTYGPSEESREKKR